MNGDYQGSDGSIGEFSSETSLRSPADVIYLALASDAQPPRDHFMPFYWGVPPEQPNNFMQSMVWDSVLGETRELKVGAFSEGSNYGYVDGHAKFQKWGQVWCRNIPEGIYSGSFDPRA